MIGTLLKSVREYKKPTILAPLFISLEVIFECLLPFVMTKLIDEITEYNPIFVFGKQLPVILINGQDISPILFCGIILLVIAMLSLACGVLSARAAAVSGCGFAKNLRQDLFYKVQKFSFSDIDKFSTASLITRLTTDVTNVQNAFQMIIRMAFRTPLMLIFSVVMSFSLDVKMSFIFLAILPVLAFGLFGIMFIVRPIFKRIFKRYDLMNNSVEENLAGIRVVKSFVREDYENKKFKITSEEVCKDFTHVEKWLALNNPIMMLCIYSAIFLVSYFGAKMIINSAGVDLTVGSLSSLIAYGVQILVALMMFSFVVVTMSISEEAANRIVQVLETDSSIVSPENGIMSVNDGNICFNNVSFKYKKDSKKAVLSDINLTIPSGSTLGIIGGTGSSKTTLIQLISRLYDVTEGSVTVGGKDVREYDLTALRNEVAVVLQKNILFSGTIKENLRWGDINASDEELVRVCKLAQADEFIQSFPNKYDTFIEAGGTNVSGGQKQRLCIARALLKKPKVLILDDSTSAVDTKTDALIRKAFREEIPDTTKIIIAQRISSVQDADNIIVLEDGKIVEMGNHEQLIAKNGIYNEIYDIQSKSKAE